MAKTTPHSFNIDAGLLSAAVVLGGVRAAFASTDGAPATIKLTGVVRDFRERTEVKGHPDFEQAPSHGFGLYSGNVGLYLGHDGKPVFTGQGNKIKQQWTDREGRPIPRHMHDRRFEPFGGEEPVSCAVLKDSKGVDAFEVCLVDASFDRDGTSRWTYRVRELGGGKDLSHWDLQLHPGQTVMPGTTPGYDHGTDGSTGFHGIKWDVTDDFAEGEFTVVLDGHYAGMNSESGVLAKGGSSADTGMLFAPSPVPATGSSPYDATSILVNDPSLEDNAGAASYSDAGGIESTDSFHQWYHDVLGVNLSRRVPLTLVRQGDGSYVFDDTEDPKYAKRGGFFPIDDQLLGNPGGGPDHNYHFTLEMHTKFTYDASAEQVFKFVGDDDVWVYIDGKLVIDLGGVHGATEQVVDLDRLGLTDGETYSLDFFFAERHRTESNFRIETNLELEPSGPDLPAVTMPFD